MKGARAVLSSLLIGAVIAICVLAGMIAFGTQSTPPPLASISAPFRHVDFSDLPPLQTISARDGSALAYRAYLAEPRAGEPERVVIAIHGSSAHSASMHLLAKALRAAGLTVYTPDLRGHGATGRPGDIDYPQQLDDDLTDLVAAVRKLHPQARLVLLGFSSGGGFALHTAAMASGAAFERAVLLAPVLGPRAPTARPGGDAWAAPYLPRIIALLLLNKIGIHAFDGLPTLAFAIEPGNPAKLTPVYSFRLMQAFGTLDYAADLRAAHPRLTILVGSEDELFYADRFAPAVQAVRADVPVGILPGLGHLQMITDPRAVTPIVAAVRAAS
jgi:pimeloyl-ACP methyl ester carboxylesterase